MFTFPSSFKGKGRMHTIVTVRAALLSEGHRFSDSFNTGPGCCLHRHCNLRRQQP